MARVRRYDLGGSLSAPVRREDGTLVVDGHVARTGVLVYQFADGSRRREYVAPEVLFDPASIASLRLRPTTNTHPPQMLDSQTARGYAVGATGENVRADGDWLAATFVLFDHAAIEGVESGACRELSCGYDCDLVVEPGVAPDGTAYDVRQVNRVYNHLATVPVARAGAGAAPRMDAGDPTFGVQMTDPDQPENPAAEVANETETEDAKACSAAMDSFGSLHFADGAQRRASFDTIVARAATCGVDSGNFRAKFGDALDAPCACPDCMQESDQMADKKNDAAPTPSMSATEALASMSAQVADLQRRLTVAEQTAAAERERADRLDGAAIEAAKDLAAAKAAVASNAVAAETVAIKEAQRRADAAEKALADLNSTYPAKVTARADLQFRAASVLGREFRFDGLTDRQIMDQVVKKIDPAADLRVTDGVIRGRFDAMITGHERTARQIADTAAAHLDAGKPADPHSQYTETQRTAWKRPLPSASLRSR